MFCFPISDQVMVPQRTVSFNVVFCTCTHMSGCMHNYIKDKFPEERWENKTNNLMTPSCIRASVSLLKQTASLCSLTFQLLFVSPFCFQRLWYATSKQPMQLPFRLFFSSPSLRVEIKDEPCRPCICEGKYVH